MARSRAAQMIDAADACLKMSTLVDILPSTERHVRELLTWGNGSIVLPFRVLAKCGTLLHLGRPRAGSIVLPAHARKAK